LFSVTYQGEQLVLKGTPDCSSEFIQSPEEECYKSSQTDRVESTLVTVSSDMRVLPSNKPAGLLEPMMPLDKPSDRHHPNKVLPSGGYSSSSWSGLFAKFWSLYMREGFIFGSGVVSTVCIIWFICTAIDVDDSLYFPPT
jgi:hypothetical protein